MNFSQELVATARTYIDREATYHQYFAGNCITSPGGRCLENGIGPSSFDCSGLVIRAMSKALGIDVINLAEKARHVRDLWHAAGDSDVYQMTDIAVGALAVLPRRYTIDGEPRTIPGHIGIISTLNTPPDLIHANPHTGKVEEIPMQNLDEIMGYLTISV